MKSKLYLVIATLVTLAMLLAACAPAATPEKVVETVIVIETSIVEVPGGTEIVTVEKGVTPTPEAKPFEGVTVDVLTFTGPRTAAPLQRRAPDFAALTGAQGN